MAESRAEKGDPEAAELILGAGEEANLALGRRREGAPAPPFAAPVAGALAILNVFLIGIWLASGGDHFWPVWSILGCAVAVGVKALPPFEELRQSVRSGQA